MGKNRDEKTKKTISFAYIPNTVDPVREVGIMMAKYILPSVIFVIASVIIMIAIYGALR